MRERSQYSQKNDQRRPLLDTNSMIDKSSLSIEFDKKIEAKFG